MTPDFKFRMLGACVERRGSSRRHMLTVYDSNNNDGRLRGQQEMSTFSLISYGQYCHYLHHRRGDNSAPHSFPIPFKASSAIKMASRAQLSKFTEIGKKIVGAGLNYKSLALEKKLTLPSKPIIFLKATSSYINVGQIIEVPKTAVVNYEVELGVVIGKKCKKVGEANALDYIGGYCLALDMTNVSTLDEARKGAEPWDLAKAFDTACPVSEFIPKESIKNPDDVKLWLKLNGELKQSESTSDMIFSTARLISYISQFMTLEPGDLLLTGSPAGIGPVKPQDVLECGLDSLVSMKFCVKASE